MFRESAIHGSNTIQLVLSCTALFDNRSFVLESWLVRSDTGGKERNMGLALNIFPGVARPFTPAVGKIDAGGFNFSLLGF